ncbi:hypothetical protein [Chryseolinea sp. H1M3-3]|uniref:hypothetical protein n=1 Tax=Chryseolinea sp. H1M3-3 TaxID=3034144 RepID=UPI0023EBB8B5|nr:hypothetical protein [Chryseolinea sp. H1M3-3]
MSQYDYGVGHARFAWRLFSFTSKREESQRNDCTLNQQLKDSTEPTENLSAFIRTCRPA